MITKAVRFTEEEDSVLKKISKEEHISESSLMKKFILEGIQRYKVEKAIDMYEIGEVDLNTAARFCGWSVRRFMTELERRGVKLSLTSEMYAESLKNLSEIFGDSSLMEEMRRNRRD